MEETLKKTRGDPMDIGLLNQTWEQERWQEQPWQNWNQEWPEDVDAINKGKGKGKSKGKGKGKGKGG